MSKSITSITCRGRVVTLRYPTEEEPELECDVCKQTAGYVTNRPYNVMYCDISDPNKADWHKVRLCRSCAVALHRMLEIVEEDGNL